MLLLLLICWLGALRPLFAQPLLPRIFANGIVYAAAVPFPPAVAPGSIISIYGVNLNQASGTHAGAVAANTLPVPTSLNGVQVMVNGRPAPLLYSDSNQINVEVPWETAGASYLSIETLVNGVPSNVATLALTDLAPGIFAIVHASGGSLVTSSAPAAAGEYLTVYWTGLGRVTNQPATGAAAPSGNTLSTTLVAPMVYIGGTPANVLFSGLAPGFVGQYQVNVQVPPNVPYGNDITTVLSSAGAISNTLTVALQPSNALPIEVSVSPISATVQPGTTEQFVAEVSGADNSTVRWSINGIAGGNSSIGTISSSGLYTAPATAPDGNLVFVSAAGAGDLTVAGTATVIVPTPVTLPSPLGRFRVSTSGLWVNEIERRGGTGGYGAGYVIENYTQFDPLLGHTVAAEASLQLDEMKKMGVNAITFTLVNVDSSVYSGPFDADGWGPPPGCFAAPSMGLLWPQPTSAELTNLKAFFDLVQSKGIRIRLWLPITHMEEQPPANAATWLGAILGVVGQHPALDAVMFDGDPHLLDASFNYTTPVCGVGAEPPFGFGPSSVPARYVKWAIGYAISLGIPARKLSVEAIVGSPMDGMPAGSNYTGSRVWNPLVVLRGIFDDLGIPNSERTYALSFYEHRKCDEIYQHHPELSCTDIDPHTWAEQTLQNAFATEGPGNGIGLANGRPLPDGLFCGSCMYAGIGTENGARVLLTEMGGISPIPPNWKAEQVMESLLSLLEKYRIEGGSYYQWVDFPSKTPTDPDAVKRRGLGFIYNPVQKEILDMGGFHLIAIPNASFEGDIDAQGMPSHWTITGSGTGTSYFLAQETGQPEVPSRGKLRSTADRGKR